jgi:ribonuclease J
MSATAPAPAPAPANSGTEHAPREQGATEGARSHPRNGGGERGRGGRGRGGMRGNRGAGGGREMRRPVSNQQGVQKQRGPDYLPPPPSPDTVRVVPLGGVEEVGRNMFTVETNNDIFVFDVGFQFVNEGEAPGVDYMLPNTKYLEVNQDRIRAVFVTHGHLDHIGGVPFLMSRFGNPPIYTQNLSAVMIAKRQEEYPDMPKPNLVVVNPGSTYTIGSTKVRFIPVTHSIPDSMGILIETPHGNVIVTGDLKLEHEDGIPVPSEVKKWGDLGKEKNLLFIADSTNAEIEGFSIPDKKVHDTLEEIIKTVKGRLIIGTFASQFERMIKIIEIAEKYGKKVVMEGRSIKTNLEIAQKIGLLSIKADTVIPAQELQDYAPDKIVVLATGAQGEEFAALMRMATKQHKNIVMTERDTVVLSSSVIPGNELSVQKLKDNLFRNKVTLIHYRSSDVHSGGHGRAGELVWINKTVGSKFFMPAYGYYSMTASHAKAVEQAGRARESIIISENGMVIDIEGGEKLNIHKQKVPNAPLMVDGFAIGDQQEVVIRDRQALAKDGMFVIIATIHLKTGKLRKSPDIISRGFVYLRESQDLLNHARILIKKTVEDSTHGMNPVDLDYVKDQLTDTMAGYLYAHTNKAPMVIPVLIGV